jgi:hypothetical protein
LYLGKLGAGKFGRLVTLGVVLYEDREGFVGTVFGDKPAR